MSSTPEEFLECTPKELEEADDVYTEFMNGSKLGEHWRVWELPLVHGFFLIFNSHRNMDLEGQGWAEALAFDVSRQQESRASPIVPRHGYSGHHELGD